MIIRPYGTEAMLVDFEQQIDSVIHGRVMEFYLFCKKRNSTAIRSIIPAYCSVTILFDPAIISYNQLKSQLESVAIGKTVASQKRTICIPVCYEPPFALDLREIMKQTALTAQAIIDAHTASDYLVYMMGFVPGFAYLGKLNASLFCARKAVPRQAVPIGAVAIAAAQTAIYPFSTPGGWQILGNTPIQVADLSKPELSLFSIGDNVRFESISLTKYHQIIQSIKRNTFDWEQLYV